MIFNLGESGEEKAERLQVRHKTFLWWPRYIGNHKTAWLCFVNRRLVSFSRYKSDTTLYGTVLEYKLIK